MCSTTPLSKTHALTHSHAHTPLHPNSRFIRVTPDKDFPLQILPAHVSVLFADPSPHHTLPPWRSCWKVLLGLGCQPHAHMVLNKQASVVCGFVIEFPQKWREVGMSSWSLWGQGADKRGGSRDREGEIWEKGPGDQPVGVSVPGLCVGKGERYRLP